MYLIFYDCLVFSAFFDEYFERHLLVLTTIENGDISINHFEQNNFEKITQYTVKVQISFLFIDL